MTDKELIQALRCCVSGPKRDGCRSTCVFFNGDINWCIPEMGKAVSDRLEALLAENERLKAQVPKWRPVSEPPEEYCRCLAMLESGEICDVEFEVDCNNTFGIWQARYDYDTLGFLDSEWDEIETVTHWMPRPSTEGGGVNELPQRV